MAVWLTPGQGLLWPHPALNICRVIYIYIYREREREREHTPFKPYPPIGSCLSGDTQKMNPTIVYVQGTTLTLFFVAGFLPFLLHRTWVSILFQFMLVCSACSIFHKYKFVSCWLQKGLRGRWEGVVACCAGGG